MSEAPPDLLLNASRTTAATLLALEYPPERSRLPHPTPEVDRSQERTAIEHVLTERIERIEQGDFSDLESLLTCQAQLLHSIFLHATRKYAANTMIENSRFQSNVALKSQHYCRMTITALHRLQEEHQQPKKSRNELIRKGRYAALDTGRKTEAGSKNTPVATVEKSGSQDS